MNNNNPLASWRIINAPHLKSRRRLGARHPGSHRHAAWRKRERMRQQARKAVR